MKTLGSFTILCAMHPPWVWATHWDFFQKVSSNVITMSPVGSFQSNHNKTSMWFNFTTNSQRTHEVVARYIVVTLEDTFWKKSQWVARTHGGYIVNKIVKEPRVFIQKVPSGYFGGYIEKLTSMWSLLTLWSKWWIHCKRTQHVSPGYCLDKLLKKSQWNLNVSPG